MLVTGNFEGGGGGKIYTVYMWVGRWEGEMIGNKKRGKRKKRKERGGEIEGEDLRLPGVEVECGPFFGGGG